MTDRPCNCNHYPCEHQGATITQPERPKLVLPAGYSGGEGYNPDGTCRACKSTGAVFHGLRLINPYCEGGRIVSVETVEQDWRPCKCHMGQFWRQFHPLNVRAKLTHPSKPWHKEVLKALEIEKARIIQAAGGSYHAGQDTFLSDLGFERDPNTGRLQRKADDTT